MASPVLPLCLLVEDYQPEHDQILDELQCVSLNCHHANMSQPMIHHLHARDTRVMVYTVNDVERVKALLGMGIDGLFTDNLAVMARHFPDALAVH